MAAPIEPFDLDALVSRLRAAASGASARAEIKTILEETVKDPDHVRAGMPDFEENDVILYEDDAVSIWHCRFMPGVAVPAHDHQMSATIAVYRGIERNDFFAAGSEGEISKSSEVTLAAGDVLQIGPSAIHAVACTSEEPCCGIHVYLGRLTTVERSLFDTKKGEVMSYSDDNYNRLTRAE